MILFLDAVVVLVVLGILALFEDAISAPFGRWAYWMLVATCIVVGHFLVVGAVFLYGRIAEKGFFARTVRTSRRQTNREGAFKSLPEMRAEKKSDEELGAYIEKHPRDAVAVEILCERLEKRGDVEGYLRETEYLLTLKSDMTVDQKCTLYHKMADLYIDRLGRPDRGRMTLRALCEEFPRSYQATLARKRLERMDEGRGATSP